jgi:hypothetical protein
VCTKKKKLLVVDGEEGVLLGWIVTFGIEQLHKCIIIESGARK